MMVSPLQKYRYEYQPKLPEILRGEIKDVKPVLGEPTQSVSDQAEIKKLFPCTYGMPEVSFTKGSNDYGKKKINVGVILSGGQAPGGHNVICGLFDALKKANPENNLIGFKGGPSGLVDDKFVVFTEDFINEYRNTGGFDIIGSGRTKLETEEQFEKVKNVCAKHGMCGIVIIGGDDSNTNAAVLAEYFASSKVPVSVIGCPKTIDGDLKNKDIEVSFGFDTATKVYSELIGNIERDANSAKKYWHFIKLMGRSASHIALECALETQPNLCIVSEEVEKKGMSLSQIVDQIADAVAKRAEDGNNFGVVLIPEGLIEFIPEIKVLISELNDIVAKESEAFAGLKTFEEKSDFVQRRLTAASKKAFLVFPDGIKAQLLMDRDPHGNVQVSRIETEKLLIELVGKKLDEMKAAGTYCGKFSTQNHFFGYEGRCSFPSNFDSDYCYSLGYNAYFLMAGGFTGYLSSVRNLCKPARYWKAGGVPITMMMNMEVRNGKNKPVIRKALVDLEGKPFAYFASNRDEWARKTCFVFPGAIQYAGPAEVCDRTTITLALEHEE
ncbi:MAG: diphosphate--fructose-6-phosphate 1-phosphotransferase [Sphaerochaetaceae bacterium]|nr:diphosphate--fructose-6-phosphate 1-phosphotransferase [Sphaerochaetaceae bacterium]MDD4006980.1 diphosphate--fructose-6-phosphate 1-phosphotransferase [Sphaerochaetaceae bacterium]